MLFEFRHGETPLAALLGLLGFCVLTAILVGLAISTTLDLAGMTKARDTSAWSVLFWLAAAAAATLTRIGYRWWRWLAGTQPRHPHRSRHGR